eukprot:TRINITY_DN2768_c0_g1_i1.p1 TRINITY_DN2768_c0_g1~~TRINITY_DN2768_c0_g1_i1.p1  ORF type:complete len:755 (+),score=92.40 TRINITY_DN2768_c0_g1_i1:51-2315(+)
MTDRHKKRVYAKISNSNTNIHTGFNQLPTSNNQADDFQSTSPIPRSPPPYINPIPTPEPKVPSNSSTTTTSTSTTQSLNSVVVCPAEYVRATVHVFPRTSSLLKESAVPYGFIIHPLNQAAEKYEEIPIVDFGNAGVIRCRQCRAYINPYVMFLDAGKRWKCNLCSSLNEVPPVYYCPLDSSGKRQDWLQRPELTHGAVEIVASAEYVVRPPQPAVFFFCIDVCYYSISSGMLNSVAKTILECLDNLPGEPRTKIGLITYDSHIHFYNLNSALSTPQMCVIDENNFGYTPDVDVLVGLKESRKVLATLLERLPKMFAKSQNSQASLGSALKFAFEIVKKIGGKLIVFSSIIPTKGHGALKLREDVNLLGTEKEASLLNPQNEFYKEIALEASKHQVCIDLFLCSPKYTDIATLSELSQLTGGQVYYYPEFVTGKDTQKFEKDLERNLTRPLGLEAIVRNRCTKGIKVVNQYGHFLINNNDLLAMSTIDADKAFAVQVELNDALTKSDTFVCIQTALLYTTSSGERRIRVFTVALPTTSSLKDCLNYVDLDACMNMMGKMAISKVPDSSLQSVREALVNKCAQIIRVSRSFGAGYSASIVLPESLKMLPSYVLSAIKSVLFRGGKDVQSTDVRSYAFSLFRIMPIELSAPFLYPRLYALHNMPPECGFATEYGDIINPPLLNLSSSRIDRQGVFLLDNGQRLLMWFGKNVDSSLLMELFGVSSLQSVDLSNLKFILNEEDSHSCLLYTSPSPRDS